VGRGRRSRKRDGTPCGSNRAAPTKVINRAASAVIRWRGRSGARLHLSVLPRLSGAIVRMVKLLRTYTMQVEALQRYRGKGQQKVTVEHVHVHSGGQAIVGAVTQGGGVSSKMEGQPHAPTLTHEPGQTLPREIEAIRKAVPSAGG
jgi:hypothetical protein